MGGTSLSFGDSLQDVFPVVGRFVDPQGRPAASRLSPDLVATRFAEFFS
jgi:hypothetical protein